MLDAASAEKRRQDIADRVVYDPPSLVNTVLVENNTGADLDTGEVVKLLNPKTLPTDDEVLWETQKVILAGTPDATTVGGAIVAEPIPDNELGLAYLSGVVACTVNVTHASLTRCDAVNLNTKLETKLEGSHDIVWRSTGTGDQYAYVRMGPPRTVKVLAKPDGVISPGETNATVSVWANGGDTGYNLTGVNFTWMDADDISVGKEIIVTWFPDEMLWRITHAECE